MTETSSHIPKKADTKVIIKRSTIDQIMSERKKRKQMKDQMKKIQKKNKKIHIKLSLERIVAVKKKQMNETARSQFLSKVMAKQPPRGFTEPVAVMLLRTPITAIKEIKEILNGFGLRQPMETRIIVGTPENMSKLKIVNLYITYGPIHSETIRELIIKRGRIQIGDQEPIAITSNSIVKEAFAGKVDSIECIEDLVNEITQGKHFDEIFSVLSPFIFSSEKFRNYRFNKLGGVTGLRVTGMDEWLLQRI
ncbi:hypothetical protein ENUP19_0320G0009 [Entamoeba nuttalli]|uniref:60S ribosomal protein L7, putative n=2 Tax=Entamoeba nuttalli TaxID=412467 RepID=K2HHL8_ENTNP|nr:60S ribosomal protein L7, putative [Entamoeba nuttalli P19]EKE42464.1 60S ribosomal protein L7, putative [Entamoeba nuttalli P19]|eukprot:XP_008855200.1 60S ribosomal protein L7, putative [Entamoeba nuttalli P19]